MKKIEAIIRTDKLEDLKEALTKHDFTNGMTVSQVLGYGKQKGFTEYVRGQKVEIALLAKIKIEIVCLDWDVDALIEIIIGAVRTGEIGDGKIFVSPVERVVRIRTAEEDSNAI
ncbi:MULTISPECIES: P-II family nitrogen regulator [unclassified Lactococcus]|uniref:P-II family nitrogen regulator n=1 Tax=unclassified Lactococcus TaxID=2643510 RepID=UPI0011C74905|nr:MULTISPECIES: P-II family nitrogen regulator [unclassified Lactococcus]MQW22208.1 transcriptional regulator [Lactococcus sp. dk101]TXK45140.1 P-II family nitrogen regulator [Lactococcus sp. dk310]TXK51080.1 P-II family nitrogen regulator [Lactococcus sp. dk322]